MNKFPFLQGCFPAVIRYSNLKEKGRRRKTERMNETKKKRKNEGMKERKKLKICIT